MEIQQKSQNLRTEKIVHGPVKFLTGGPGLRIAGLVASKSLSSVEGAGLTPPRAP